ncbi:MAG: NAD-dependent epimerase/dehydratase family protein [Chloroflexi bacterium]|nr:NAD-dependent epimerase/dehydratase family protein [Chloroflexota bacterium]
MKVLVMGGTRFNGLHLVQELVRQGHDVTIFNRGVTQAKIPRAVRRLYGDRKDHQQMREVLGKEAFDCVQDISAYTRDDVQSMVELFQGRTGHYICASSTVVYAATSVLPMDESFPVNRTERQSEYGRNKIACEEYLTDIYRRTGFPVSVTRFSMVFGPHNIIADREQRMFIRLLQGRKVLIPGDGTTLSQIGHVEDEARALAMMMHIPRSYGQIYNVTGKQYWSDEGYVDTFAKVLGVEAKKVFVPAPVMDELWSPQPQGRTLIQRLAPYLHHWNESTVFSIDKLRAHLGFEPAYTFEAAVEQTYDWFLQEGLDKTSSFDFSDEDALLQRLGQA